MPVGRAGVEFGRIDDLVAEFTQTPRFRGEGRKVGLWKAGHRPAQIQEFAHGLAHDSTHSAPFFATPTLTSANTSARGSPARIADRAAARAFSIFAKRSGLRLAASTT